MTKKMTNPIPIAENHFTLMKEIPSSGIQLREEVRKLCEMNTCGHYGKNWTCPPAVESIDIYRRRFQAFDTLLIVYRVYSVKSSFDWKGMQKANIDFKNRMMAMKKEMRAAFPQKPFHFLGAGACHLCRPCTYEEGEPCRHPQDAIVSMEACGMDVMRLMKDHDLPYTSGKNTVTFIGGVLYCRKQSTSDRSGSDHQPACSMDGLGKR